MHGELSVLIFIGISCSFIFADSLDDARPLRHSFQLEIDDLLTLHPFKDTWVCYKLHLTTSKAIRFGLSLDANYRSLHEPLSTLNNPKSCIYEWAKLSLTSNYISYFNYNKKIKPYYGVGPFLSLYYSEEKDIYDGTLYNDEKNKGTDFGINGLLGLEWFFYNHFSLFTEYNLQGGYFYGSYSDQDNYKYVRKNFSLSTSNCLIGFSIYLGGVQ